ncbi:MAG: hypothetical protein JWL81_1111 [Verrucomicrobiales bacterium]|nr:hypothetical protein [Verrucomicrobiales bacterium]
MRTSLILLPLAALLAMRPALACGPFFKASLLSPYGEEKIILAPPVADVWGELITAPGAPEAPGESPVKAVITEPALPGGLTISEEGLAGEAWPVLQRDVSDLWEALEKSGDRMAIVLAYSQTRRTMLLKLPLLLKSGAPGAAGAVANWPKGLPAEFRLYVEGAGHFQEGRVAEAVASWEKVLALPEGERRFRGTWAAWMLGRTAVESDAAAAVKWFQKTRSEARAGKDSLNRAAASFGWEALAEQKLMEKDPDGFSVKRAERLVWLLARHVEAGGGEPYFLSGRHHATNQELPIFHLTKLAKGWLADEKAATACASSPYLRQVVTACLLPINRRAPGMSEEDPGSTAAPAGADHPAAKWLAALEKSDAAGREALGDRLAWAAYESGDYALAGTWLKRAEDSPMTHWLRAKLALQQGEIKTAAKELELARPGFEIASPQEDRHEDVDGYPEDASALQKEQFQADLGLVRLAMDDFPGSLDALSRSGFHEDAAYVLEQVVTLAEAEKYAVKWPLEKRFKGQAELPKPLTVATLTEWLEAPPDDGAVEQVAGPGGLPVFDYKGNGGLHHAIARRLAREDNLKVSREFLPTRLRPVLDLFLKYREAGQNKTLPKPARAAGYWKAALIHRYAGMELWGYAGAPDNAAQGGAFEADDLRGTRLGVVVAGAPADPAEPPRLIFPAVSAAEKARLAQNTPKPGKRFNYRYHAYGLAKLAFAQMPDNSPDLAVMMNLTGWWFAKFDEAQAREIYNELQRRCPNTPIGREAKAKGWLVPVAPEVEDRVKGLD